MRFIISPAKKMVLDDNFAWRDLPRFADRAETLLHAMQSMDAAHLQTLWKCSDALTDLNVQRLEYADIRKPMACAVFAYDGIQYQHLAAQVMTQRQLDYLQEHLRIVSGLYGLLKPFDGVIAYRLEMQAKLKMESAADLYAFWGRALFDALAAETDVIVNLASVEYARAITPFAEAGSAPRIVTCLFGTVREGKLIQRSTQAKAARGTFIRWCTEHETTRIEEMTAFDEVGYTLNAPLCTDDTLVFTQ